MGSPLASRVVHVHLAIGPGGGPAGYLYNLRQALLLSDAIEYMRQSKVLVFHDWTLLTRYFHTVERSPSQRVYLMPHTPTDYSTDLLPLLCGIPASTLVSLSGGTSP